MGNMAYNREHTNTYLLRFNHKTDRDIIEKLENIGNKTAYIKRLIREDMKRAATENHFEKENEHENETL